MENLVPKNWLSFYASQEGVRHTPQGFYRWEEYLADWDSHASSVNKRRREGYTSKEAALNMEEEDRRTLQTGMSAICDTQVPPRYVSVDLLNSWLNTAPPPLTHNRPFVLPGYVLFFPRPVFTDPDQHIYRTAMLIVNSSEGLHCWTSWASRKRRLPPGFMMGHWLVTPDDDYRQSTWNDPKYDHLRHAGIVAINSWLTHAYEPELITQEPTQERRGTGFGRKPGKQSPIAPTWIGRNFKIRRESVPAPGHETGIKVRPHWRSGHWHTVRHGKGREQERLQWYRPTYVNADTAG